MLACSYIIRSSLQQHMIKIESTLQFGATLHRSHHHPPSQAVTQGYRIRYSVICIFEHVPSPNQEFTSTIYHRCFQSVTEIGLVCAKVSVRREIPHLEFVQHEDDDHRTRMQLNSYPQIVDHNMRS